MGILKSLFGQRTGWFHRYTEHARRTVFFARWEALQLGSDKIDPEHIALGLLRDGWITNEVIAGVEVGDVREALLAVLPRAEARKEADLPLSTRSKRVLANAASDADLLLDEHIGDEHLLLGLLREGQTSRNNAFRSALSRSGHNLQSIRSRIKAIERALRSRQGEADAAKWRNAGLPQGYAISRMLYNAASATVIVELTRRGAQFDPKRLFLRALTGERYEHVADPSEDISYESPVTCERVPLLVFNTRKVYKSESGRYLSADWEALHILNLQTRDHSVCVSKENFLLPEPYDERGWIDEVISLADDGSCAYVRVGLGRKRGEGNKAEVKFDYHLAKINLHDRRLELMSQLKNIWF